MRKFLIIVGVAAVLLLMGVSQLQAQATNTNTNIPQPPLTCNINGVEVPGPCPLLPGSVPNFGSIMPPQGQFGPGSMMQPGTSAGPLPGTGSMMGPSPEDQERMEKQRQEMEQRALTQMKRGTKQFSLQLDKIKKRVAKLQGQGVTPPTELTEVLAKADSLVTQINSAQSMDSTQDLMDDFSSINQTIQEYFPQMERLAQFPTVLRQAKKEIARLERQFKLAQTKAARSKIDISEIVMAYGKRVGDLKAMLTEAEASYKSGQAEEAFNKMEDYFDQIKEAWDEHSRLQAVSNFGLYVSGITRGIKEAKRQAKLLKSENVDTTELDSIVASAEAKLAEIKGLMTAKPLDVEAVMLTLESMEDVRNSFEDKVKELKGDEEELPGIVEKPVPQFNLNFLGRVKGAMDSIYSNSQSIK